MHPKLERVFAELAAEVRSREARNRPAYDFRNHSFGLLPRRLSDESAQTVTDILVRGPWSHYAEADSIESELDHESRLAQFDQLIRCHLLGKRRHSHADLDSPKWAAAQTFSTASRHYMFWHILVPHRVKFETDAEATWQKVVGRGQFRTFRLDENSDKLARIVNCVVQIVSPTWGRHSFVTSDEVREGNEKGDVRPKSTARQRRHSTQL